MRALYFSKYGKYFRKHLRFDELKLEGLQDHQVLVEIHAAGINPVDYKIVQGKARLYKNPPKPCKLGFDLSGIVLEAGSGVDDVKVGDEIYSKVGWEQMGTIATHLIVDASEVALKPKNCSFEEAAGLPLASCTALQSLQAGNVGKGTTLLIHGGSGGVGSLAIQYAKHLGAKIYTTTSTANIEMVLGIGVDHAIDYTREDYRTIVKDLDVVFDTVGSDYTEESIAVLKHGGKLITIAGPLDHQTTLDIGIKPWLRTLNSWMNRRLTKKCRAKGISYRHLWTAQDKEMLKEVAKLVEEDILKPIIDTVYPFEDAVEALTHSQTGRSKGKLIVKVK